MLTAVVLQCSIILCDDQLTFLSFAYCPLGSHTMSRNPSILFRQLFDRVSCTYTYLLGCNKTRRAILIDPVKEHVNRDLSLLKRLELNLQYVANTHVHADHVTGSGAIKTLLKPAVVESIISSASEAKADIHVKDGDIIECGDSIKLHVLSTPGHTSGCVSYYCPEGAFVFTGDCLLVGGCGRTDFQQGNSAQLYTSVHQSLFTLPEDTSVFPAHDYNGNLMSTIGEEKRYNPRLSKSQEEFIQIMKDLKLDLPKLIDIAVPQNMICGL